MTDPVLYILMRNDLDSLNPGKAMAQASHAYGAFLDKARDFPRYLDLVLAWQRQTPQLFGTTIVLEAGEGEIKWVFDKLAVSRPYSLLAGWVHDPTYPLRDGLVTHILPLNTCAFVFGEREKAASLLEHLELHP